MLRRLRYLWTCHRGATAVEFALVCAPLLLVTIGIMEFSFALYQWNAAEKSTQMGVRIAVVSNPVARGLTADDGKDASNNFGDEPMPDFFGSPVVCSGGTASCSGGYTFDPAAHDRIVNKMRQIFGRVGTANVVVEYRAASLGFVGKPCGPVPSVTVRLQDMAFDFFVIDALAGLVAAGSNLPSALPMPPFPATMVGEDLSNHGSTCPCLKDNEGNVSGLTCPA